MNLEYKISYHLIIICFLSSINCATSKTSAVVFGGGPGGLTAAMELQQAGFKVKLYEKSDRFGGKMVGYVNANHLPREHSIRIYDKKYLALGDVLDRAGINPPTGEFPNDSPTFTMVESTVVSTEKGFAFTSDEIVKKMTELGVSSLEFQYFLFQLTAWKLLPLEAINNFYNFKFSDFIDGFAYSQWQSYTSCKPSDIPNVHYCLPQHTAEFHKLIEAWMTITVAAVPEDSAPPVMFTLQLLNDEIVPVYKGQCSSFFQYFNATYMASGPTSSEIVDPWVTYIRSKNIEMYTESELMNFKFNSQIKFIQSANVVSSGKVIKVDADIFILALPVDDAEFVLPGITQGRSLSTRWTFGVQFYLPCLPKGFSFYRESSLVTVVWDSSYDIVYAIQSPEGGMWEGAGFDLKNGVEFVLSLAISDVNKTGILNGKSFLLSTRTETLADALAQIHFPEKVQCNPGKDAFFYTHKDLVDSANLGLLLEDQTDEFYQENKDGLYKTSQIGPLKSDGNRWILHAPLYLPTPQAKQISCITEYSNLFVAGEYVATPLVDIPTMEHAAESGKLAAQAAIEKLNIDHDVPKANLLLNLVGADTVTEYDAKIKQGVIKGEC